MKLRLKPFVLAVLGLNAFSLPPCSADIRESRDELVDRSTERALELAASSKLHISPPRKIDDIAILITAAPCSMDVRAVAIKNADAKEIARILETAIKGTVLEAKGAEWSQEDEFAAARALYSRGRLLSNGGEVDVPAGRIVDAFRKKHWNVSGVLRIPMIFKGPDLPVPTDRSGSNYTWYDISQAQTGLEPHLVSRLTVLDKTLGLAFPLFVPVITFCSIVLAIVVGSQKRLPLVLRRRLYMRLALWPTFGSMAIHAPFAIFYLRSGHARAISDAWFGSTRLTAFAPFLLLPILFVFLVVPISVRFERRLFGSPDGKTAPEIESKSLEEQALDNAFRKRKLLLAIPFVLALIAMMAAPVSRKSPVGSLAPIGLLVVYHIVSGFVTVRHAKEKQRLAPSLSDPEVDRQAGMLAQSMGLPVKPVVIRQGSENEKYVTAIARFDGTVELSHRTVQVMDPAELRFILAHELAHVKLRHNRGRLQMLVIGGLLLVAAPFGVVVLNRSGIRVDPVWIMIPAFLGLAINLVGIRYLSRRQEFACDRLALQHTGDLAAAHSALRKMAANSQMPAIHEFDENSTHPALSRRLAALEK